MSQSRKLVRLAMILGGVAAVASPALAQAASSTLVVGDFTAGGPAAILAKLGDLKDVAAAGKGKIAVLLPDTASSARWATVDAPGFEAAFKAMGLTPDDYIISNAQGSASTQQTQAEQAITQGASVLVITNLDSGSAAAIQANAKAQGVVAIDYDRLTLNGSAAYYVSFDNEQVGKLQGEGLLQCNTDWKVANPHIYELGGSPTDNNATLFENGYDSVLKPAYTANKATLAGQIRVPNWDNQVGQTMFEQAFQADPKINSILAANDGLAQSAISVLKNNKIPANTIPVTGQDATLQGAQNILAGYQCMTVYKPIYEEVGATAALAVIARAGETASPQMINGESDATSHKVPSVLLTPQSVTKANMQATVIADQFLDPKAVCAGDFAAACTAAGVK